MTDNLLWEEYQNEWSVNLSNSVCTPMFTPCLSNDLILWFKVQYKKQETSKYNHNKKEREVILEDILKIFAHGHFPNSSNLNLVIFVTTCYIVNDSHPELKSFKITSEAPFVRLPVGTVSSRISKDNEKTIHGEYIACGSILFQCHVFISGHLGSVSSHFQMKISSSNQSAFLKDFTSLCESKTCSDLEIQIKGKNISAHKLVLVTHSPVFKKQLEHDSLESRINTITISDASFEVFELFLKCLYSGSILEGFEGNSDELFALAVKYEVGPLKEECLHRMVLNMDLKNICKMLPLVYDSEVEEVTKMAKSFAVKNFVQLKSSPEWMELAKFHPHICYSVAEQVCDTYIKCEKARYHNMCDDEEE